MNNPFVSCVTEKDFVKGVLQHRTFQNGTIYFLTPPGWIFYDYMFSIDHKYVFFFLMSQTHKHILKVQATVEDALFRIPVETNLEALISSGELSVIHAVIDWRYKYNQEKKEIESQTKNCFSCIPKMLY